MAHISSDCKDCNTPKPVPQPASYKVSGCCPDKPSKPGMCRIFVLKGNVARNKLPGSPGGLPVYVVEHEGRLYHGVRIVTKGPVVFHQATDPDMSPYAWGETTWPVEIVHAA